MPVRSSEQLMFESQTVIARFIEPDGGTVQRPIEIRTNPITGRTCRIAFSRVNEKEAGTETLPSPPPDADNTDECPFCQPQVHSRTPRIHPDVVPGERLRRGESLLFPNLFPSSLDPEFNLTAFNASSSPLTLKIMLIVVLLFVPVVLAYQIWAYKLFSVKVTDDELAHEDMY